MVPPPLAMDPSPPSSESEDELQLPGAVVEEKKTPDCGKNGVGLIMADGEIQLDAKTF